MTTLTAEKNSFFYQCKQILALALPMTGSQLINVGSGFLCMTMLAALGHDVLAASALIFSSQLSIMISGMSILFSLSVLVSQAHGSKDDISIGNYLQQGWTLALCISLPIILIFWHIDKILLVLGQSQVIASIVQYYFHAFVWAVVPGCLYNCNMQFGYAINKKALIVFTSAASVIILLVTANVLIFGKFGFPKLGVAGLGYATFAQYSFSFLFTTLFFYYNKAFSRYQLFKYRVHRGMAHFIKMFKIGWPISVQMGGEMLSFFVSGIMIGWISSTALASFQIVNQYYSLIIVPIFSLSQACGILVGQAVGAKKVNSIKNISYASFLLAILAGSLVATLFITKPRYLASFYIDINDPRNLGTLHLTVAIFSVIALSQLFDALRNILVGILRGLLDTRFAMYMSIFSIWVISMPLSYILAFPFKLGAVGFVIGGMLGMLSGVIIMLCRWYKMSKNFK